MVKVLNRLWARVSEGFISEIKAGGAFVSTAISAVEHPFELLEGERAVDVSNTQAAVGDAVDHKGNVARSQGRKHALGPHEPAYHDRSAVVAPDTATVAAKVSTSTPSATAPASSGPGSSPATAPTGPTTEPIVAPEGPATPAKGK